MQFNLRAASGTADEMRIEHTRRVFGSRRGAGDLRYTFESGHSVAAQYLSLWANRRHRTPFGVNGHSGAALVA